MKHCISGLCELVFTIILLSQLDTRIKEMVTRSYVKLYQIIYNAVAVREGELSFLEQEADKAMKEHLADLSEDKYRTIRSVINNIMSFIVQNLDFGLSIFVYATLQNLYNHTFLKHKCPNIKHEIQKLGLECLIFDQPELSDRITATCIKMIQLMLNEACLNKYIK